MNMGTDNYEIFQKQVWSIHDKVLVNLLLGRRGGGTTMKIIDAILKMPSNANQLSKSLNLDYGTVTYHVKLIEEHEYVTRMKIGNSYIIHPSDRLIKSLDDYMTIKKLSDNPNFQYKYINSQIKII